MGRTSRPHDHQGEVPPSSKGTTNALTSPHAPEQAQETRRKVINRLKRARGQLDGVIRAVEEGRDCKDVITQLAAATSALQRAGFTVISSAMRECLTDDDPAHDVNDLEKLFLCLS